METTNTIKGKEVIAYKGMNSDMSCRDFKYELGKSYKIDKAELYQCGFHACLNPIDVLDYYLQKESLRYFKVKLSGEITKCGMRDTNVAATEITILEEIPSDKLLTNTEWWKHENILDLLYWSDGFARVQRGDGLWNFINKDGKLLSNEWFEWVDNFKEGFARLQRSDGQYNFIDKEGKILSDEWFNLVDNFQEGFAVVQRGDKKYNLIDKKGKYLIDEWFYWVDNFRCGLTKVQRGDDLWNFIDKNGNYLSDEWFEKAYYLDYGLAIVQRASGEWCNIDKTGTLIKFKDMEEKIKGVEVIAYKGMEFDMTCRDFHYEIGKTYKIDKAELYQCGFHACLNPIDVLDYYLQKESLRYFKVKLSGEITKCGMRDTNVAATEITILEEIPSDKLLTNTEWWKHENILDLLYWSDGFARVQREYRLWNFIDKNGKLLSEQWFEWVGDFHNGLARISNCYNLYNFIDKKGKLLSDEWFYWVDNFNNGFAVVQRTNDLRNFIDKKGKLLSAEWFKDAHSFKDGLAIVQRASGEWCNIDKTGTLIKFKDMEEKIKQVEDIDTLKELNKNLISENERLAKKNMKLSEKYQSINKKNASLRTAIASIKGFENAEQLCAELNRLKQQNKSLSEANAKLIADAKVYLKTIDEQKKVISASEKSIGAINDKLKIITLSQQSMHQALKDSGEEKSELVKKYKEALSAKSVAQARQLELQEENIQLRKENIQLRENMINVYDKASLIQRIKYVFTKSI